MAAAYKVFGRGFTQVLVRNYIFMSTTCAFAFLLVSRIFGPIPGLLCAVRFMADPGVRLYSNTILTESPSCVLIILFTWSLLYTVEKKKWSWAFLSGLTLSLAYLARSIFIMWIPVILIVIFLLARPAASSYISFRAVRLPLVFIVSFMFFSSPWMIRNCLVLDGFEPLGTQGGAALPSGFSDKAIAERGVWFNPNAVDRGLADNLDSSKQSPIIHEKAVQINGKEQAMKWIRGNIGKLPLLTFYKITSEWKAHNRFDIFDLFFSLFGLIVFFSINPLYARVILGLVIASTVPVAITHSAGGRFLFPIHSIKVALIAIGIWTLVVSYLELSLDRLKVP